MFHSNDGLLKRINPEGDMADEVQWLLGESGGEGSLFQDDEPLVFAEDEHGATPQEMAPPWTILVVDDEPAMHEVTRLALRGFTFEGRELAILSAYSGQEAKALMQQQRDVALILLDVVMEQEDAGLQVARYVREKLNNHFCRIVLRTGQPGQAPERQVLLDYDINDYKAKSELTATKLFSTVLTALRSYRDIMTIDANRQGLRQIIDASASLFTLQSMEKFVSGLLTQLTAVLGLEGNAMFCKVIRDPNHQCHDQLMVVAATGSHEPYLGQDAMRVMPPQIVEHLHAVCLEERVFKHGNRIAILLGTGGKVDSLVFLEGNRPLNHWDQQLAELFCNNAAIAFDNIFLYDQFQRAQQATVQSLSKLAEFKDTDTGDHIRRVEVQAAQLTRRLGELGLFADEIDETFIQHIGMAATLHDVGKVGIPESVLLKNGKLTEEEFAVMQGHSAIGGRILGEGAATIHGRNHLAMAAEIAAWHHERFDGKGYPDGLAGEAIPLSARIVAVVDVFDALTSRRPYKEPWRVDRALELLKKEAGHHFDPRIVPVFCTLVAEQEVLQIEGKT